MVVQHNMQAMNANRMLNITTGAQSKSTREIIFWLQDQPMRQMMQQDLQFLKMRKQIRGLDQASTNAQGWCIICTDSRGCFDRSSLHVTENE